MSGKTLKRVVAAFVGITVLLGAIFVSSEWRSEAAKATDYRTTGLQRTVTNETLVSLNAPSARFTVPPSYTYLGGQAFVLYDTSNVEQHIFAALDPSGKQASSVLVFQFEAVRPGVDWEYSYAETGLRKRLGPLDMIVSAEPGRFSSLSRIEPPGSDSAFMRRLVRKAGVDMPADFVWMRFAYVPETDKRTEVLIFAMESLEPDGVTRQELLDGGERMGEWDAFRDRYIDAVVQRIEVEPLEM